MRRARSPLVSGILAGITALLVAVGPVAAVEPSGQPTPEPSPSPGNHPLLEILELIGFPVSKPDATPSATAAPAEGTPEPAMEPEIGLDVSYPQCDDDLPAAGDFAIVGVNGGRVFRPNRCLAAGEDGRPAQLAWAGRSVELYANTANPGPHLSRYWPDGQVQPRACRSGGRAAAATARDCAYTYGWNAAADSYRTAVEAFVAVGWADEGATDLPWATTWWLDVETANTWRADPALNVAALEGARDFLASRGVAEIGFYSTPRMWARITGATDAFADHPAWHAGAADLADALARCSDEAFTGGELRMVQWVEDGVDHNVRCP